MKVKKIRMNRIAFLASSLMLSSAISTFAGIGFQPGHLRCEYLSHPPGIDVKFIRASDSVATFAVAAGMYEFRSEMKLLQKLVSLAP